MRLMVGLACCVFLSVFVLLLPALATAQSTPPAPGWYQSNGPWTMYEGPYQSSILKITWAHSYIYQRPGADNLYWYALVAYQNIGSYPVSYTCSGAADPSLAREHFRGTQGIPPTGDSSVAAEETFCSRYPTYIVTIAPGETYYYWSIYHNVPWGGEVYLELFHDPYARSAWVNPWYYPFSAPPPPVCPPELVRLGTCFESQP